MKRNVKFYISSPDSLMVQLALCAHTVITVGVKPPLVVGFEGKMEDDIERRIQVLQYYSTVIAMNLQMRTDMVPLHFLQPVNMEKTGLHERLDCIQFDQGSVPSERVPRRTFIPKHKRRMLNCGRMKQTIEKKDSAKQGNI